MWGEIGRTKNWEPKGESQRSNGRDFGSYRETWDAVKKKFFGLEGISSAGWGRAASRERGREAKECFSKETPID